MVELVQLVGVDAAEVYREVAKLFLCPGRSLLQPSSVILASFDSWTGYDLIVCVVIGRLKSMT